MKMLKLWFAFSGLLLLTCQCSAQGPAPAPAPAEEYLGAHNQARGEVGVGPLRWSAALEKSASLTARLQRDKQNCSFADLSKSRYGGNQLWAGGVAVTPRLVVEAWVEEKKYYDYADNSCAPDHRCGVYTQVVWRKSAELGCAQAACAKEKATLTICLYNPPGNIVGEKPY
ncbi:STS14 protein [Salvia miltiorrhiza]|uniref:STS14 protein n=1 Tax=Salvia miltiorrhiza TaxID=226208 RepID=UPI0025AC0679|nr:STS14 protein [Salvia miltiorrhiza]